MRAMKTITYSHFIIAAAKRFRQNVIASRTAENEESIHDFRVAVKEIAAFQEPINNLLAEHQRVKVAQWMDRLNKLYRPAGKLRNAQVIYKLGKHSGVWDFLPLREVELLLKIADKNQHLQEQSQKYRFAQLQNIKHYINLINDGMSQEIEQTITSNLSKSIPILQSAPNGEWHEARRALKTNYYLLMAQKECNPLQTDNNLLILTEIMGKELGKWHDWLMLRDYIEKKENNDNQQKQLAIKCITEYMKAEEEHIISRVELLKESVHRDTKTRRIR